MRAATRIVMTLVSAIALTLGLIGGPASARTVSTLTAAPTAVIKGSRVVIKFTGKQPTRATLVTADERYRLTKSGKTWRTKKLSTAALAALSGTRVRIKARIAGKNRTLQTTVQSPDAPPAPPSPPAPAPLFPAPGVDSIGQGAWDAVKGYFLDSTFTNCVQGWGPSCFSEERYGHFANYTQVYCRLTSAPGADITNYPKPMYILGAEQKANGAWGVSYSYDYGDGQSRIYTWFVQPDGSVSGSYWYNADPNSVPPTEQIAGLQWIRGAKDCSY